MAAVSVLTLLAVVAMGSTSGASPGSTSGSSLGSKSLASPSPTLIRTCSKVAANAGSDSNIGTAKHPFRTVGRLLRSLKAGQVGCLRGGVYTPSASTSYVVDFSKSNISIISFPGERAVLRGSVLVRAGAGDRLANVSIEGVGGLTGGTNTVEVLGATDFVLEDSDVTNNWHGRSCVIIGSPSDLAVRPVIRRNRFHECGNPANNPYDHGIYVANATDGVISNNVFWDTAAYAIQLYPNAQRMLVSHNVIDNGGTAAIGVIFAGSSAAPSSGNIVEYNVIANSTSYNIDSWWEAGAGTGNIARNNCVWGGGAGNIDATSDGFSATANVVTNPLFVNASSHDYRLQAGSPCLAVVGQDTAALLG